MMFITIPYTYVSVFVLYRNNKSEQNDSLVADQPFFPTPMVPGNDSPVKSNPNRETSDDISSPTNVQLPQQPLQHVSSAKSVNPPE